MEKRSFSDRVLRASVTAIYIYDLIQGKNIFINSEYTNLTGYTLDDIQQMGQSEFFSLFHPDDQAAVAAHFDRIKDVSDEAVLEIEYRFKTKEGRWIWCFSRDTVFARSHGSVSQIMGTFIDVTERKQAERALLQVRKLEAISTLAGGLAHDFNNALSTIVTNVELLKLDRPDDREVMEFINPILDSARRMAHLTSQLMAYAQGGKYRTEKISLSRFIEDRLPSILHHDDPNIHIETDLPADLPNISADPTQMQMILSAITANAAEAVEGTGYITISTGTAEINEEVAKNRVGSKPGSYVYLRVEDDGKGMDEEAKKRIFDPFFTTKFQGRGLGMAATYGIVKNHEGWIDIHSEVGKGTAVQVYFPAVYVQEAHAEEKREQLTAGKGTILAVEDEAPVMAAMKKALQMLGYDVLTATSGREAIKVVKTHDGKIELVILDIGLPDMPGDKVLASLLTERPSLKVLICSGYAPNSSAQGILDKGARGFVQKPFSLAEFSSKVNEVIETD